MPGVDGNEALKRIRQLEKEMGVPPEIEVKVIMTTAMDDPKTVLVISPPQIRITKRIDQAMRNLSLFVTRPFSLFIIDFPPL